MFFKTPELRLFSVITNFSNQMKKLLLFVFFILSVLPYSKAATGHEFISVKGVVSCQGKGIANVPVSDGISVVVTDAKGRYNLTTTSDRKHIFYTLPSGYESPVVDGVPVFYKNISSANNQKIDFEISKAAASQENHAFIAWADPQVLEMAEFDQLKVVVEDLKNTVRSFSQTPVHAISLGDEVFDRPLLFDTYKKMVAETGLHFYQVMGNHDMDYNKRSEELSTVTFSEKFGPAWYSFNVGKVHYVVLKDVFYYGYSYRYIGYIPETELQWLEQDLSHVKPGSTVIVGLHIPTVETGPGIMPIPSSNSVMNNEALFKILAPFNTHILAGHSHTQWNTLVSPKIFEHVHTAASGAWWQGEISIDGCPKGYTVYKVNGDSLSWYFKGVNMTKDEQFKIYPLGSNSMYPDCILANVYNYDPCWKVSWYENGKYMGNMQQYWGFDPDADALYQPGKNKKHSWLSADKTNHLFKAPVQDPTAKVTVVVTDRFGNTYKKELAPSKAVASNDGWRMVWKDEFSNTGLPDSTRWNFDIRGNSYGWGNNELEWYTEKNPKNAIVSDGTLKITARKEPTSGKAYSSARLTTKNKGDWKYGRVEVRAKLPSGRGTWPAIWMLSTANTYGGWPKSGEIDIMEHVGFDPGIVHSTVHTGAYNHVKHTQVGKPLEVITAMNDFHVYATEWDENEIRSYVDGNLYFTFINEHKTSEEWPFDQPFHLILNLAIGGGWGGQKGVDNSIFPCTMEVDYVRVYQR
jgi:beta-glucanase (GH16 family)